jgi:hypothetical protein
VQVRAGDIIEVSFHYRAGASIPSLEATINVAVVPQEAVARTDPRVAAYA